MATASRNSRTTFLCGVSLLLGVVVTLLLGNRSSETAVAQEPKGEAKPLTILAAGYVDAGGKLIRNDGVKINVGRQNKGIYLIHFDQALKCEPVVVVTGDFGASGAIPRVTGASKNMVSIQGQNLKGENDDFAFHFIIVAMPTPRTE